MITQGLAKTSALYNQRKRERENWEWEERVKAQRLVTSLSPTTAKHQRIHFITSALIQSECFLKGHFKHVWVYVWTHKRTSWSFWEHSIKCEVIFHVQYIKSISRLSQKNLFWGKNERTVLDNVNLILYKQLHLPFNYFDFLNFFFCFFFLCFLFLSKNLGYSET